MGWDGAVMEGERMGVLSMNERGRFMKLGWDARSRTEGEVILSQHSSGRERKEDAGRRTHDDDMIDRVCLALGTHLLREHLSAEEKGYSITFTLFLLPASFCRFLAPFVIISLGRISFLVFSPFWTNRRQSTTQRVVSMAS